MYGYGIDDIQKIDLGSEGDYLQRREEQIELVREQLINTIVKVVRLTLEDERIGKYYFEKWVNDSLGIKVNPPEEYFKNLEETIADLSSRVSDLEKTVNNMRG